MGCDLLLTNGTLIDPAQGIHAAKDVAFKDGKVLKVGDDLKTLETKDVIDCAGQMVSPGMIDFHTHVFWGCSHYGIEPDPHCIAKGATTVLDAGSAGADNFPGFRRYVMEKSDTRIIAFLHISSQGLLSLDIGELEHIQFANVHRAVEMIQKNRDVIRGVKVRLTNRLVNPSAKLKPLHLAREAADAAGLPIMVHPNDAWCETIDDILAVMKVGDILTHCFHGSRCGILDDDGTVRASVTEAIDRGILLDVGHGKGSFKWDVVKGALDQGILPDIISSDLHVYNTEGPVFDLVTTVSKFLYLGFSIDDAIARATMGPATVLGMSDQIGSLKEGAIGDAVVLGMEAGEFDFTDAHGQNCVGDKRLIVNAVIHAGKRYVQQDR